MSTMYLDLLSSRLLNLGLPESLVNLVSRSILGVVVLALGLLANWIVQRLFLRIMAALISRTRTTWDDALLKSRVLNRLANMAPALVIYILVEVPLAGFEGATALVQQAVRVYLVLAGVLALDSFANAVQDIYRSYEISRERPIRGFVQVVKIVIYFVGVILVVSLILGKSPVYFLSGLGALTAVLLLVFRDTILGLVAGIQLTANKMVSVGDWIEMHQYGADGDVLEVSLNTVKVQNWDKTITTIPTYALISESFRNYRGMMESGGRRIKRSINIDVNTIRFCDEEMLERFSRIQYIREYIESKKEEVAQFNVEREVDGSSPANGRRLTNIGTFRAYVTAYLQDHPMIHQSMTFLVRQLAPTEQGLPIEIYVFCKDTAWANYEAVQSDLFDHILAVVPEFDLRVFQHPSGVDFQTLKQV